MLDLQSVASIPSGDFVTADLEVVGGRVLHPKEKAFLTPGATQAIDVDLRLVFRS